MGQIDTFGEYVRRRLEHWGEEFALHRDFEYLGHASKNMLQVVIDHRGEMPPPNVGFKPLEVDQLAQQIEDVISELARQNLVAACAMRAMYCGTGRRGVERLETARMLAAYVAGVTKLTRSQYYRLHEQGVSFVRGSLGDIATRSAA